MRTEEEQWELMKKVVLGIVRNTFRSHNIVFLNQQQCEQVADFIVELSKNTTQLGKYPNN